MRSPAGVRRLLGLWVIVVLSTILELGTSRPLRAISASQAEDSGPLSGAFTYGIFMDANFVRGRDDFERRIHDLRSRSFTSILFTNNVVDRDEPLLDVADQLGFDVIFAPQGDLRYAWWSDEVSSTIDTARNAIYPIVQRSTHHPSLLGYSILDDAPNRLADKAALAIQVFREADPDHPASPVFIAHNDAVYASTRPDVILTYQYAILAGGVPCDLASSGSVDGGSDAIVSNIRHLRQLANRDVPVWVIMQAHGWTHAYQSTPPLGGPPLREPTIEEIRLQHWLAVGEGAKGIFWFAYDTEQFWTGLRDNPALFGEVTKLAERTRPVAKLLGQLMKVGDQFNVASSVGLAGSSQNQAYASTLQASDGTLYVVIANRNCAPATLVITSQAVGGQLRDLENDTLYDLGAPIALAGGDGRLFELAER